MLVDRYLNALSASMITIFFPSVSGLSCNISCRFDGCCCRLSKKNSICFYKGPSCFVCILCYYIQTFIIRRILLVKEYRHTCCRNAVKCKNSVNCVGFRMIQGFSGNLCRLSTDYFNIRSFSFRNLDKPARVPPVPTSATR